MAKDKTSFVLYSDNQSIINLMTDEQAGLLLKTLFSYVNDENPIIDSSIVLVFEMIKLQLKRDLKKWEQTKNGRSIAGKASAEAKRLSKLNQQNSTNSTNVDYVQQQPTKSTVSVSVSDSVNVNKLTTTTYNIEKAIEICLRDLEWIASVSKTCDLKEIHFPVALKDFKENCISLGKSEERTIQDFKYHFVNWVKKKKDIKAKETVKDRL